MPPLRAFIVEDSPIILANLVATLEELAQVQVVGTAAEEREALRWITHPPAGYDLMIIDIFLKSGSGLGVLLAAQQAALPARRVVLTNFANPDIRKRCAELGADRVFDKSSELEELINYCAKVADGAPRTGPGALS
jgi:DNA-binding NarL/FixJ family response regulator